MLDSENLNWQTLLKGKYVGSKALSQVFENKMTHTGGYDGCKVKVYQIRIFFY
jgi:hypothetical protein